MIMIYWFISLFLFISGSIVFVSNRKHLLSTLLSLEYIVLSLFLMISFYLGYFGYEMYFVVVFLTFSVCEGALGLSVLVSMIRTHGNDYFQSFSVLQC